MTSAAIPDQPPHDDPILVLDTSALLRRYLADRQRPLVLKAMDAAPHWAVSALARSELMLALHHGVSSAAAQAEAWAAVGQDWEAMWEIPLDSRALNQATEIGARFGVDLVRSLHLACAARLPGPVRFATFDPQQIPAAAALGFELVTPQAN